MPASSQHTLASRTEHIKASEIRELLKLVDRPGMISFAGGIPDPMLFRTALFADAYRTIFSSAAAARQGLQYSPTEGYPPLRRWIAAQMAAQGVPCEIENILITSGSQQALDLIAKLTLDAGSTVLVDAPTYLGALQCFSAYQSRFAGIDLTSVPDLPQARLIYLVPDFANPSGKTLTLAEREAALDLAERTRSLIVEDSAYSALRFEGEPVAPIAALDIARTGSIENARTLYCGSFSKTLAPALRIGWICGPKALIRRLVLIKQAADLHTATINQMAVAEVAQSSFAEHVARAVGVYRPRRDAMLAALSRHGPKGMGWSRPEGGLFVWVTLPEGIDAASLLQHALSEGVAFVPGKAFFADGSGANSLRLSFSSVDEAQIEAGIYKLCDLIARQLAARLHELT